MKAVIVGAIPKQVRSPQFIEVLQLPTYPVPPPPEAEVLGLISWDLPGMVKYIPGTEILASVEMVNPSAETRLYAVSYYFLDPEGVVVDEGFITFCGDSLEFTAFYLPAQGVEPAFFQVEFSASEVDYAFGLRLLLCEMMDGSARVIQETSRVQVLMASESTYNRYQVPTLQGAISGIVVVTMLSTMVGVVIKTGK